MRYLLIVGLLVLAACTDPVRMQNPTTGQIALCGPYPIGAGQSVASAMREAKCIDDFKAQGYVRLP